MCRPLCGRIEPKKPETLQKRPQAFFGCGCSDQEYRKRRMAENYRMRTRMTAGIAASLSARAAFTAPVASSMV